MGKKRIPRSSVSRPQGFHRNSTSIEYANGETEFISQNIFTAGNKRKIKEQAAKRAACLQDPRVPDDYKLSPSRYYIDQIWRCTEATASGFEFTDEVATYVVQAVREFGVDALRLNAHDYFQIHPLSDEDLNRWNKDMMDYFAATIPLNEQKTGTPIVQLKNLTNRKERSPDNEEDYSGWISDLEGKPVKRDPIEYLHPLARAQKEGELRELAYREGLGLLICNVLRFWREQVQRSSLKQRRFAAKCLRRFGEALIPETRGKRERFLEASHYEVKIFYLKELYRPYHIENALCSAGGPRNHGLRVKEAAESYGQSVELIREFWGLDDSDEPDRQPFTVKDMARELTARQFRISHQRVSNILSS